MANGNKCHRKSLANEQCITGELSKRNILIQKQFSTQPFFLLKLFGPAYFDVSHLWKIREAPAQKDMVGGCQAVGRDVGLELRS